MIRTGRAGRARLWALGVVLAGCGGGGGAGVEAPSGATGEPQPTSSEWTYATANAKGGVEGECAAVKAALPAEALCKSALCAWGVRLADDWLSVCSAKDPGGRAEVEALREKMAGRSAGKATNCEAEARAVLESGCQGKSDCVPETQKWMTRCGADITPLVVRAITVRLERTLGTGDPIALDGRSCDALAADLAKASGACKTQFECRDALPAWEAWSTRCIGSTPPPVTPMFHGAALRARAQEPVDATPVDDSTLDPAATPLVFADGLGGVVELCGERPATVEAYLETRTRCAAEPLLFVRIAGEKRKRTLSVGRVTPGDDITFARRFPLLTVRGEEAIQDAALRQVFTEAVDAAIKVGAHEIDASEGEAPSRDGIAALVSLMDLVALRLQRSPVLQGVLKERDAALVPLFTALGHRKRMAYKEVNAEAKWLFGLRRAAVAQLADVSKTGRVRPGAATLAGALDFEPWLPQSVAAYLGALAKDIEAARVKATPAREGERLAEALRAQGDLCAAREKQGDELATQVLACAAGPTPCAAEELDRLGIALDVARQDAADAWRDARFSAASYGKSGAPKARAALVEAACRDPWW